VRSTPLLASDVTVSMAARMIVAVALSGTVASSSTSPRHTRVRHTRSPAPVGAGITPGSTMASRADRTAFAPGRVLSASRGHPCAFFISGE